MPRNDRSLALLLILTMPAAQSATRWAPPNISSDQYESSPTFTPDGREMFYMLSDRRFSRYRVMMSKCANGAWSKPVSPLFAAPESMNDADPFVTLDGKRLYFVSDRARDKPEDHLDIWYVDREPDGRWLHAKRLPEPVNSKGSELLPRATADGRLYFGSSRPGGLGQGDIYIASPKPNGQWDVRNVGAPINTPAFEYEADISRDERTLILVANRGERSHLYHFIQRDGQWIEQGQIPARQDVFQIGPLLSPKADRLLFGQADGERSGEMFVLDLSASPDPGWPPDCR